MSTDRTTCNGSFWTKEEDKIFENTLAIYFADDNLLMKMAEALPGKSLDDITHHYNLLVEDMDAIESGRVPLPKYPKMQSTSNQKSRFSIADVQRRRGVAWTEEEHRSFLRGLEKYGQGDWRSISRHCVMSRTPTQVASHAQKYFNRLKAVKKNNRRTSIHDISIVDPETAGTSQVPNTEDMIRPAGVESQVASTNNESMLPRESTNAEQMIAAAGGESSGHNAAFVDGMNNLYPDMNDEFILGIDDLIVEPEGTNEPGFLVDTLRSQLPSKQLCSAAGSGTSSHPITRIGSELEALIADHMVEDYDISSIFDIGRASTSHAMLNNAAHSGTPSYPIASIGAQNAHQNTMAAPARLPPIAPSSTSGVGGWPTVASVGARNTHQSRVAAPAQLPPIASSSNFGVGGWPTVASIGAKNTPQNRVAAPAQLPSIASSSTSGVGGWPTVASIGARDTPQKVAAPAHLPPIASSSNFGVGGWPTVASIGASYTPQNWVAAPAQLPSIPSSSNFGGGGWPAVASIGARNTPQNRVAAPAQLPLIASSSNFGVGGWLAVASIDASNTPQNRVAAPTQLSLTASSSNFGVGVWSTVASISANNAPQNRVAAQLPLVAPSSNFGVGVCPNLNTSTDDEDFFNLDDLFKDEMI